MSDFKLTKRKTCLYCGGEGYDQLKKENEHLKEYRDKIYDYVQATNNTSPKFLGHHIADALVMDHKKLREENEELKTRIEEIKFNFGSHIGNLHVKIEVAEDENATLREAIRSAISELEHILEVDDPIIVKLSAPLGGGSREKS